jgi:hypothetical protein
MRCVPRLRVHLACFALHLGLGAPRIWEILRIKADAWVSWRSEKIFVQTRRGGVAASSCRSDYFARRSVRDPRGDDLPVRPRAPYYAET